MKRCLTLDPKCRPTAKELLLDPFIAKSKGPALLSELVANSLEEIERYRLKQFKEDGDDSESAGGPGNHKEEGDEVDIGQDGLQTYINNNTVRNQKSQNGDQDTS